MIVYRPRRKVKGRGLVNTLINKLPFELHIPGGYQYCGPGTRLAKRLARGDPGINPLDAACKDHDIAYSRNRENLEARHEADKELADKAWQRVLAKDASFGEKAAAWAVTNTMKAKTKMGMGLKKKQKRGNGARKKKTPLRKVTDAAKKSMRPGWKLNDFVKTALKGAREEVKKIGGKSKVRTPRILPVPTKTGGFLPFLIPIFAGLSAAGALSGGAAGIAKAINDAKAAKRQLDESTRHNRQMEAFALGKGLNLKPYREGLGLHLKPYSKN